MPHDAGLLEHSERHAGMVEVQAAHDQQDCVAKDGAACAYCGIAEAPTLVQCVNTGKFFCNGIHPGGGPAARRAGSHIVQHLVRTSYNQIRLHPENDVNQAVLQCYSCANDNIFEMGCVPAVDSATVLLLCRNCLLMPGVEDQGWDADRWEPLVQDRALVPWLAAQPTEAAFNDAEPIPAAQIAALERQWQSRPDSTLQEVTSEERQEVLAPMQLSYDTPAEYAGTLAALVREEMADARLLCESSRRTDLFVRWAVAPDTADLSISFRWPMSHHMTLAAGDRMIVTLPVGRSAAAPDGWAAKGEIARMDAGELTVMLAHKARVLPDGSVALAGGRGAPVPLDVTSGFTAYPSFNDTSFMRQLNALESFRRQKSMSAELRNALLGKMPAMAEHDKHVKAAQLRVPGLPELNRSQELALRAALTRPLTLIQGPPGTGKTLTSAALVYHLQRQSGGQVLVAASSNVAVDALTAKVSATGLKVVRLMAKSRQDSSSIVAHLALHNIIDELLKVPGYDDAALASGAGHIPWSTCVASRAIGDVAGGVLARLHAARVTRRLAPRELDQYRELMLFLQRTLLQKADVVCVTCVGAADQALRGMKFSTVLLDEATQAAEPEALIPITLGASKLVMVGDHCQLGPMVLSKRAAAAGLTQSLFERWIRLGQRPLRLTVQYRMHPALAEFPSNTFYDGALQNGVTVAERTATLPPLDWPVPGKPQMFINVPGAEETSASGTSYLNRSEAMVVERAVVALLRAGVMPHDIGVITPYDGQRAFVVSLLSRHCPVVDVDGGLEVASVDSFQGREKEYIVLSCVRANSHHELGFVVDPRRLNVSLTRARCGLVIVGEPRLLARDPLWHALLTHYLSHGLLVEGPLNALRASRVKLPAPRQRKANLGIAHPEIDEAPAEPGQAAGAATAAAGVNAAQLDASVGVPEPAAVPGAGGTAVDAFSFLGVGADALGGGSSISLNEAVIAALSGAGGQPAADDDVASQAPSMAVRASAGGKPKHDPKKKHKKSGSKPHKRSGRAKAAPTSLQEKS